MVNYASQRPRVDGKCEHRAIVGVKSTTGELELTGRLTPTGAILNERNKCRMDAVAADGWTSMLHNAHH